MFEGNTSQIKAQEAAVGLISRRGFCSFPLFRGMLVPYLC